MSEYKMTDPQNIKNYIYAGKSIFTIRSAKTGNHFTFRVTKKKNEDVYFVGLGIAYHEFLYMGYIKNDMFRTSQNSCRAWNSTEVAAFQFLLANIVRGSLHKGVDFFHEGFCGRCGKSLTDPTSIETGLGPTCRTKGA